MNELGDQGGYTIWSGAIRIRERNKEISRKKNTMLRQKADMLYYGILKQLYSICKGNKKPINCVRYTCNCTIETHLKCSIFLKLDFHSFFCFF